MGPVQIVWFKRDLRVVDHQPLLQASRLGPVLPLVVVEPELWQQPDASARQWAFCSESLENLRRALAELGQPLVVRTGRVEAVLERARRYFGVAGLWSHEETGNGWTYDRDRRVALWARHHGITWTESPQTGVIRRLRSRNGWARRWEERMACLLSPAPEALQPLGDLDPGPIPSASDLGLAPDPCPGRQLGGRQEGLVVLESFLSERGACYHRELSSPRTAFRSCSRLSPHLAWGTVSLREVVQANRRYPGRRRGFEERLHWHCHFIQKLESQPDLEFCELHPLTAGLRSSDPERLEAWAEGRTGLPFVDACMRALIATGWINFRMRAMLMSVASYHLWLPWRESGMRLARLFVDYEPGIHWSQCQMQSGTTGINTIRIYNPIKQGQDHDPNGDFICQWVPELDRVPPVHRHQPWTMAATTQLRVGCVLGVDYPLPIVEPAAAAREARERLWALRQEQGFAELADAVQHRHGSRRSGLAASGGRRGGGSSRQPSTDQQLRLNLDPEGCG
ncbi:FAD-binding domain-containing protein [Synechococcus sp. CBW1006]|uniref:FAD-binding domain-containing protein n=1 Tax=Synechococcus sp. CBW1006 TaxID=1353138 RepID=UPI0018CCD7AB|nr:FAD-binding domain-containing protein [Synechococcus sp. CBW1006]QPN68398.1 deoxyribodipyrimidine photo-lyase [Synechococcus sp. CBW1006]